MTNDRGKSGCAASKYFDKVLLGRMTQMIMRMSPGPRRLRGSISTVALSTLTCVSPAASLDEPIGPNAYSLIHKPLHRRLAQAWHHHPSHIPWPFRND